jgi:glycosyltransferase involved in cell wall biosynthesis
LADKLISCGLSEDQIKVIPNPIPFDIFKPLPKSQLRMKNNIGPDEICVLLASDSMSNDVRKGMDLANSILLEVSKKIRIKIVTFGHGNSFDKSLDVVDFGYIKDDNLLNEIYNLVDLTFVPSRIDNLPQIMTESLAAGTPVFSLPHGDAKLILKNELGFCSDVDDIAINVDDFLQFARPIDHQRRSIIAESARVLWNPEKIMKNYFDFI